MITLISGNLSLSIPINSIPSIIGIFISVIIISTCIFSSSKYFNTCAPFCIEAQTLHPSFSHSINSTIPSLIFFSSSATITLYIFFSLLNRSLNVNSGACIYFALNFNPVLFSINMSKS